MIQSHIFKVCCMLKQPLKERVQGKGVANCVVFLFFSFVSLPLKTPL